MYTAHYRYIYDSFPVEDILWTKNASSYAWRNSQECGGRRRIHPLQGIDKDVFNNVLGHFMPNHFVENLAQRSVDFHILGHIDLDPWTSLVKYLTHLVWVS